MDKDLQKIETDVIQQSAANASTEYELQTTEHQPEPDVRGLVEYAKLIAGIEFSTESLAGAQWLLKDWSLDECRKGVDEVSKSCKRDLEPAHFWRKVYQVNGARELTLRFQEGTKKR